MTYDYVCKNCGHSWEQEQSIKDDPIKECPKCKTNNAKRLISSKTSFVLKGGGWGSSGYSG
jgi:putative FmdB family regulatory protein